VQSPNPHIILIGFKHVGKSVIGRVLARRLKQTHIDLDQEIERLYQDQYQIKLTCRQIVQQKGEIFFRNLEQTTLQQVIRRAPCIISTGGGAPMRAKNRQLLAAHCIIHITAKPKQVFNRIMRKGRPTFFVGKDPWGSFNHLWHSREKVYKALATFSIENSGSVALTVERIVEMLKSSGIKN